MTAELVAHLDQVAAHVRQYTAWLDQEETIRSMEQRWHR